MNTFTIIYSLLTLAMNSLPSGNKQSSALPLEKRCGDWCCDSCFDSCCDFGCDGCFDPCCDFGCCDPWGGETVINNSNFAAQECISEHDFNQETNAACFEDSCCEHDCEAFSTCCEEDCCFFECC